MSAPWIEAARSPTVPGTNAHASTITPVIFMILHVSWVTFAIVMVVIIWIAFLSVKGRSVSWLLSKTKSWLRGRLVSARPFYYRRRSNNIQSYDECDISEFRKVE